MPTRLFIYPEFNNNYQRADILNRIAWGLTGVKSGDVIVCERSDGISVGVSQIDSTYVNTSQKYYLSNFPEIETLGIKYDIGPEDFVLSWDGQARIPVEFQIRDGHAITIDPNYSFNYEADQIAALQYTIMGETHRAGFQAQSKNRFDQLTRNWKNVRNAYLYLTGPSVESVHEREIDREGLHIICNSLVKNFALLEKIQPNILMFSDPAYHFGISKYAASFRSYVKQCMHLFSNLVCMVPERYAPLTSGFLGNEFNQRVIGIPVVDANKFNFPTTTNFFLRRTSNVLTLMMIPVASSFAETVHILGADGRANQDKGYWSHAKSSQLGDQMRTIYESHPSLGRDEDVDQYYREHCELLESQLSFGETFYKKTFISDTPSLLPALQRRIVKGGGSSK